MWADLFSLVAVAAYGIALLVLVFANPVGQALGVIDYPDPPGGRKRHGRPTPQVGGIAILAALLVYLAGVGVKSGIPQTFLFIALVTVALGIVGFLDDRRHVNPWLRLALSSFFFSAVVLVEEPLRLSHLTSAGLGMDVRLPMFVGIPLSVVALLGLQNSVNMADGKNGLVAGMALSWALFLTLVADHHDSRGLIFPVFAVIVFLIFMFNLRGKIFLGDCGSYALSSFLGLLALECHYYARQIPSDVFFLWFFLPVMDCARLMIVRYRNGNSPLEPDVDHFHHHLATLMPWRYGLIVYLAHILIPGVLALLFPELAPFLILAVIVSYALLLFISRRRAESQKGRAHPEMVSVRFEAAE